MPNTQEALFTNKIFLCGALPLLKTIVADVPSLQKKFESINCVYQVSCLDPDAPEGKWATNFVVTGDEWKVNANKVTSKDAVEEGYKYVELQFKTVEKMNAFFKGKIGPGTLPKFIGLSNLKEFLAFMMALLKMSSLLTAEKPPENEDDKRLTVKCYFYLLSSGISTLNKMGHPEIHDWTSKSPDRVYAWKVDGEDSVSAYIRIKAGKSKAGRGEYKRALPFFTMRFNNLDSALGILMSIDDMIESVQQGKLIMDGAPEFGAQIGAYMMEIGAMAK